MKFMMLVCAEDDGSEPDDSDNGDGSFPWLDDVTARGIRLDGDRTRGVMVPKTYSAAS